MNQETRVDIAKTSFEVTLDDDIYSSNAKVRDGLVNNIQ